MSKISNKELAEALTERHGLSKQDAEKFVAKMFEVLGKGLQTDKQVKVKGLGTFKVISVSSRKSIDVNTGEPIVIEGRDKINFTPDASMRDDVNRPFAQFDTVVLNDGVDFTEIDKKYEESEKENTEEEVKEEGPAVDTEKEIASGDTEKKEDTVDTEKKEEQQKDETIQNENQQTVEIEPKKEEDAIIVEDPNKVIAEDKEENVETQEAAVKTEELTVETEKVIVEPKEEPIIEKNAEQEPVQEEVAVKEEARQEKEPRQEEVAAQEEEPVQEELTAQHRTLKYVCIAAIAIIVLLGASAFYLYNELQLRDHRIENLEAQVLEKTNKKATAKKNNNALPATKTKEIVSSDDIANTEKEKTTTQEKAKTTFRETDEKQSSDAAIKRDTKETAKNANNVKVSEAVNNDYNKDARIRTGAYNIVGIDHTITARAGQSLTSISRSQLGPGMECYVEAVNGGRTEFKAGEKVKIPKLKLKKKK